MQSSQLDDLFRVGVITSTPKPQTAVYAAMHQDYSESYVLDEAHSWPDEAECGRIAVSRLLAGERGHYGPLEHAQIVFNVGWFPHSVMQQARTHRVGVSFDVQSMRYTGERIFQAAWGELSVESVFYLRPPGFYCGRDGGKFEYTAAQRIKDLDYCFGAAVKYKDAVAGGMPYEQARSLLPFDYRQHFVVSFTMRALMHFLDLRSKKDAQEEIRVLCDLMMEHFRQWSPQIADWYEVTRLHRARLAP